MAARVPSEKPSDIASGPALESGRVTGLVSVPVDGNPVSRSHVVRTRSRLAGSGVRREFARYLLAGGFAFFCDAFTLFSLTQFLKVNYLISAPIGFAVGTVVNYVLSRKWVFERRTLKNTPAEMTVFTLIGVVGLGMNELILWFFQEKLGIYYLFAKGVSGVVVFGWNFGARKLTLFR